MTDCAESLRRLGIRVCSFETLPLDQTDPITIERMTLREVLDTVVEIHPGYRWDEPHPGLFNLFPDNSPLDSPVPSLTVTKKPCARVLEEDLHVNAMGVFLFEEFGEPDSPLVDIDSVKADLRDALNTIVYQLESVVWQVVGQPGAYYLSFTSVLVAPPEDWSAPLSRI